MINTLETIISSMLSELFHLVKKSKTSVFNFKNINKGSLVNAEKLRKLCDSISAAILIFQDKKLAFINPESLKLTNYSEDEILRKIESMEIIHPDFHAEVDKIINGFENGALNKYKSDLKIFGKNDDEKWIHCVINAVNFESNNLYLITAYDITERKNTEFQLNKYIETLNRTRIMHEENSAELRELNSKLLESKEKLKRLIAEKDKFLFIISHDLKTPFNSVLGFAEILLSDVEILSPNEIKLFAHHIHEAASNLVNLLTSLLEWARMRNGNTECKPEEIDLEEIVDETILVLYDNAYKKNINLRRDVMDNISVYVDKKMITSVLQNLLYNAIKFSYRSSIITVSAMEENEHIRISIKDSGIGISKRDIAKLFNIEEHYSTAGTENEKGTGLGLSLCKDLVEMNNGKIWAESTLGEGSTFHFTVPVFRGYQIGLKLYQVAQEY